jgi:hypothetical protein
MLPIIRADLADSSNYEDNGKNLFVFPVRAIDIFVEHAFQATTSTVSYTDD